MSPKKILWLSRHAPGERVTELRRIFGEGVEVQQDSRLLAKNDGVGDLLCRMQSGQFDEVVLVAPTSILDGLCQRGVNPIWPRWDNDSQTSLGFDRILQVRKDFQEVTAEMGNGRRVMWLSQFAPAGRQLEELRRLYGADVQIVHSRTRSVEEATEEYFRGNYHAMVAVVPMAVLERLSAVEEPRPLQLLWSEATKESDPARVEFHGAGGQGFRFDRFRKFAVRVETEQL